MNMETAEEAILFLLRRLQKQMAGVVKLVRPIVRRSRFNRCQSSPEEHNWRPSLWVARMVHALPPLCEVYQCGRLLADLTN